jgi:MFS family permease
VPLTRPLIGLIAAETISSLGSLMSVVALPWFVLETTGSPARMAVVLAAESAPLIAIGIPSSHLVARLGSRRALLLCDAIWAPATALIPILHFADLLTFPLLVALAFLAGIPWAAHVGSQNAIVPELLGEDVGRVAQANAALQTLSRLAYFAGPALGGVLLSAFGAPTVLLLDAASFAISLLIIAAFVPRTTQHPRQDGPAIAGGWQFLKSDAWMRPVTASQALSQAAFMAMTAAIPVLAFATYDHDAKLAGVLLAVWGGGAMLGGIAAYRLVQTADPYRLGARAWAMQALPLWAIAATTSPAVAAVALAASGLANGIRVPPIAGLTAQRIPQPIRAETLTVASALVLGAGFLALLAAGPALDNFNIRVVWALIAAMQTLAALIFAAAALRRDRHSLGVLNQGSRHPSRRRR